MATAPTYITHKELKRIFPQIDEFDQKTQLFGWVEHKSSSGEYVAYNSGLVTEVFVDGASLGQKNQTIGTSAKTAINYVGTYSATATSLVVDDGSALTDDSYIKINDEILLITNISTNTLTVTREMFQTDAATISNDTSIYQHFYPSANGDNLYDSDNDFFVLKYGSDPNDVLVEAGEDFTDMVTQYRADASRYFDSRVDPSLPREQLKDKSGNYDYMVIRTVGLIAAAFMIKTKDHKSELAISFMEEADKNIELLNEGKAALSWQNTADASQGLIRDISYTSGAIRPVDTRGNWNGTWDLVKVIITTGGVLGTAKYSVYTKNSDGLKQNQVVTDEIITGDFQPLAGSLQIRFAGETDSSTANVSGTADEWEIEVTGQTEYVDSSDMKSIKLTRTGTPARRYYK